MDPRVENEGRARHRVPRDIMLWRRERLVRAGFSREVADELASDGGYDLHELLELVDRGCPPALAVRILAPL
jgi:hypothetical protein